MTKQEYLVEKSAIFGFSSANTLDTYEGEEKERYQDLMAAVLSGATAMATELPIALANLCVEVYESQGSRGFLVADTLELVEGKLLETQIKAYFRYAGVQFKDNKPVGFKLKKEVAEKVLDADTYRSYLADCPVDFANKKKSKASGEKKQYRNNAEGLAFVVGRIDALIKTLESQGTPALVILAKKFKESATLDKLNDCIIESLHQDEVNV